MKKQLLTIATAIFMAAFTLNAQMAPTIVGQGFTKGLVGIEVDGNGKIWLTEQGSGNNDGAITVLHPNGTASPFMVGLPSALTPTGELSGPVDEAHAWAIMGMNVFLGLRYGVLGEERSVAEVASVANAMIRHGLGK